MTADLPELARALRGVVGEAHVLVDDDLRAPYETDWIRRRSGRAAAVVRPGTTEEGTGRTNVNGSWVGR